VYRSVWYIFYMTILKSNRRFRTRIKLVQITEQLKFPLLGRDLRRLWS